MKYKATGKEEVKYHGKFFEVVDEEYKIGDKTRIFERVRRSPGVRLIIVKDDEMLLNKEYRVELEDYDMRLPGGKVFDSLDELKKNKKEIKKFALEAAKNECEEEVGLIPKKIKFFEKVLLGGATIDWDMYYFVVDDFEEGEQNLEEGEIIEPVWKTFEEVKEMCFDGSIKENRSIGIILKFLNQI